jgi:hypothetical protein
VSERKLSFIVFGSCILVALVVLGAYERTVGRAEMKLWQEQWYAAHPVISQQALEFPTPSGKWIPFSITFDTFGPGMEGRAWMTKDGSVLYIQGIPPTPAPKPSKRSKPRFGAHPTIDGVSSFIVRPGQMCASVSLDKNLHYEASCEPDPDVHPLTSLECSSINTSTGDCTIKLDKLLPAEKP